MNGILGIQNRIVWFFYLIEGIDAVVDFIADDAWGYEDELTSALSEEVEIWDWLYLWIHPRSLPMTNSRTNNIMW